MNEACIVIVITIYNSIDNLHIEFRGVIILKEIGY